MTLRYISDNGLDHTTLDANCKDRLDPEDTLRHVVHVVVSGCEMLDQKYLRPAEVKSLLEDPIIGAELAALTKECSKKMSFKPLRLLGTSKTEQPSSVLTYLSPAVLQAPIADQQLDKEDTRARDQKINATGKSKKRHLQKGC